VSFVSTNANDVTKIADGSGALPVRDAEVAEHAVLTDFERRRRRAVRIADAKLTSQAQSRTGRASARATLTTCARIGEWRRGLPLLLTIASAGHDDDDDADSRGCYSPPTTHRRIIVRVGY
jgi:hypothetical protein